MASYAAAIKEATGVEPELKTGRRGQFSVFVNDQRVVDRKGGLLAMLLRKKWPSHDEVAAAVSAATS